LWGDSDIIEFWLEDFNEDMKEAFEHIVKIYDLYLKNDPNWHYIWEGDYTLIRCSYKYVDKISKYLDANNVKYRYPSTWSESTYATHTYQNIYKKIFHYTSVLSIEMYKNGDKDHYITLAADRMIHVFLLQAIYIAEINGDLDFYRDAGFEPHMWEASKMSDLTKFRSFHIGLIQGEHRAINQYKKKFDEMEEMKNKSSKNENVSYNNSKEE